MDEELKKKNEVKNKIILLTIGILIGAIITTACFLIFSKLNCRRNMIPNGKPMMQTQMTDSRAPFNNDQNSNKKKQEKPQNNKQNYNENNNKTEKKEV